MSLLWRCLPETDSCPLTARRSDCRTSCYCNSVPLPRALNIADDHIVGNRLTDNDTSRSSGSRPSPSNDGRPRVRPRSPVDRRWAQDGRFGRAAQSQSNGFLENNVPCSGSAEQPLIRARTSFPKVPEGGRTTALGVPSERTRWIIESAQGGSKIDSQASCDLPDAGSAASRKWMRVPISASAPAAMSSPLVNSVGVWLRPPTLRTKIIPVGATSATFRAS